MTVAPAKLFALPGRGGYPPGPELVATVTPPGNRFFQQASDAFLDDCLAAQAKPDKDCVLDLLGGYYRTPRGYVMKTDITASSWQLCPASVGQSFWYPYVAQ